MRMLKTGIKMATINMISNLNSNLNRNLQFKLTDLDEQCK